MEAHYQRWTWAVGWVRKLFRPTGAVQVTIQWCSRYAGWLSFTFVSWSRYITTWDVLPPGRCRISGCRRRRQVITLSLSSSCFPRSSPSARIYTSPTQPAHPTHLPPPLYHIWAATISQLILAQHLSLSHDPSTRPLSRPSSCDKTHPCHPSPLEIRVEEDY